MKDEALKLALMTLEGWDNHDKWVWPETALEQAKRNTKEAITAIKEALAQPEQEPVHYGPSSSVYGLAEMILSDCGCSSDYQPLLNRVAARIMGYIDTPPAAPVQERRPYAYANPYELSADSAFRWCEIDEFTMPVYTTAAQRKPLTTEAIRAAGGIVHKDGNVFFKSIELLNRAIHGIKEKNT